MAHKVGRAIKKVATTVFKATPVGMIATALGRKKQKAASDKAAAAKKAANTKEQQRLEAEKQHILKVMSVKSEEEGPPEDEGPGDGPKEGCDPTAGKGLTEKSESSTSIRSDPVSISKEPIKEAAGESVISTHDAWKDAEDVVDIAGVFDKEHYEKTGIVEKPPIAPPSKFSADVSWGYEDLPAVMLDWSDYVEQDEKDRVVYYKVLQWVPSKRKGRWPRRRGYIPPLRVLNPTSFWDKYVENATKKGRDSASKKAPQYRKKRRVKRIRWGRKRKKGLSVWKTKSKLFRRRRKKSRKYGNKIELLKRMKKVRRRLEKGRLGKGRFGKGRFGKVKLRRGRVRSSKRSKSIFRRRLRRSRR